MFGDAASRHERERLWRTQALEVAEDCVAAAVKQAQLGLQKGHIDPVAIGTSVNQYPADPAGSLNVAEALSTVRRAVGKQGRRASSQRKRPASRSPGSDVPGDGESGAQPAYLIRDAEVRNRLQRSHAADYQQPGAKSHVHALEQQAASERLMSSVVLEEGEVMGGWAGPPVRQRRRRRVGGIEPVHRVNSAIVLAMAVHQDRRNVASSSSASEAITGSSSGSSLFPS